MSLRRTALLLSLLAMASGVYAQQIPIDKNTSIRIGTFRPMNPYVRDTFGSSWFSIALNHVISSSKKKEQSVEIGMMRASKNESANEWFYGPVTYGSDASIFPALYTSKLKPSHDSSFYYGGGAGLYFTSVSFNETVPDYYNWSGSETDFRPGLHVVTGFAISGKIDVEARYTRILGGWMDTISGVGLSIGVSF